MKTAILQVADTGPVESLIVMLESVGYRCYFPNDALKSILRSLKCDTVLDIKGLVQNWGYEKPTDLPEAGSDMMNTCDLYVDVKAVRNAEKVWSKWPRLKDRTLWYRINGGEPEIVPGCGDEINPPCPILTPNLWYKEEGPWTPRSYACWPPFFRWDQYYPKLGRETLTAVKNAAVCLTHNLHGWGYHELINRVVNMGVHCYGCRSPQGLVPHSQVPQLLSRSLALVHLKDSDAPGYSLYEAMAAGCPLVISRTLIWRNRMESLFEPGVNCLVFGKPSHDSLTPEAVNVCEQEIRDALQVLSNPQDNQMYGMALRQKLERLMWSPNCPQDVNSLRDFMRRMYGE